MTPQMSPNQALFDKKYSITLGAATAAVTVATSSIFYLFPLTKDWKFLPLVLSGVYSFGSLILLEKVEKSDFFLAVWNTFIIFSATVGLNVIMTASTFQRWF